MPFPIDHLSDPLRVEFVKIANLYEVPDFVLEATDEQLVAPEGPPNRVYALPSRKALPLGTKVATWLSAAYLEENPELPESIKGPLRRVLKGAAAVHGIDLPVRKAEPPEPEATESDYLINIESKSGKLLRLPVRNRQEAKVAVAYLKEHRHEFPWEIRRSAAKTLLTKAASLQIDIPPADLELLNIDAANFVAPEDQLCELLSSRAKLASHLGFTEQADGFKKLAQEVKSPNGLVVEGELAGEILEAVELFDKSIGCKSASIGHVQVVTNDQFNQWVDRVCVLKNGHVYNRDDLARLPLPQVLVATSLTKDQIADETGLWIDIGKTAAFESIEAHEAQRISQLCKMAGVQPNIKLELNTATLTSEDWAALAGR